MPLTLWDEIKDFLKEMRLPLLGLAAAILIIPFLAILMIKWIIWLISVANLPE